MPDLTTKDALLERMVAATDALVQEVPTKFDEYLPLSGGTMTGPLTLEDGGTALSNVTVGTTYSAAWTADESPAANTVLTDDITNIPVGTYIAIIGTPEMSLAEFGFKFDVSGATVVMNNLIVIRKSTTAVNIIKVTNATNTIRVASSHSSAVTFSYLERGGLTLIRIA